MNEHRLSYFVKQKEEDLQVFKRELQDMAHALKIKDRELAHRERVNKDYQELMNIKHATELESLHSMLNVNNRLHEEKVSMLNTLHQNEMIVKDIDHKQALYTTERELQKSQHMYDMLTEKNGIIREQIVLENKRGLIKDERLKQLEEMNMHREEFRNRENAIHDRIQEFKNDRLEWKKEQLETTLDDKIRTEQLKLKGEELRLKQYKIDTDREYFEADHDLRNREFEVHRKFSSYKDQLEYLDRREELKDREFETRKREYDAKESYFTKKTLVMDKLNDRALKQFKFLNDVNEKMAHKHYAEMEHKRLSGLNSQLRDNNEYLQNERMRLERDIKKHKAQMETLKEGKGVGKD